MFAINSRVIYTPTTDIQKKKRYIRSVVYFRNPISNYYSSMRDAGYDSGAPLHMSMLTLELSDIFIKL